MHACHAFCHVCHAPNRLHGCPRLPRGFMQGCTVSHVCHTFLPLLPCAQLASRLYTPATRFYAGVQRFTRLPHCLVCHAPSWLHGCTRLGQLEIPQLFQLHGWRWPPFQILQSHMRVGVSEGSSTCPQACNEPSLPPVDVSEGSSSSRRPAMSQAGHPTADCRAGDCRRGFARAGVLRSRRSTPTHLLGAPTDRESTRETTGGVYPG